MSSTPVPSRPDAALAGGAASGRDVGTPIRVVVGEDNLIAREGIVRILAEAPGIELAAACPDLDTLREAVNRLRPDVVLTDIRMPPTKTDEGIRLAQELREVEPSIGVVILSQHSEPLYALALFDHGSARRGYLLKESLTDREGLRRALHDVAAGGSVVDPRVVGELLDERRKRDDSRLQRLTGREREVLALLAEGRSNGAIAAALNIGTRGVERHVGGIFRKLELEEAGDLDRRVKAALLYLADLRE